MIEFDPENIPQEMKELPRWVLFTLFENTYSKRLEKLPWSVNGKMADITKSETWTSFDKAVSALEKNKNFKGLGFVLGDGIFGIDLDHVIDQEGVIESWAEEIIEMMDSYTELSPSGTGVHIYAKGKIPPKDRKNGNIEMYDERRYFTVTGHPYGKIRPLSERTHEAASIHRKYLKRDRRENILPAPSFSAKKSAQDVEDLIAKASNAKNGDKFRQLYKGSAAGYASQSQADQALCNILAFYAGGDASLVDAAFRSSGLMRPKWDSRRGNTTYGEMTVGKALSSVISQTNAEGSLQPEEDVKGSLPVDIKETESFSLGAEDKKETEFVSLGEKDKETPPAEKEKKITEDKKKPVIKDDKEENRDTELFSDMRRTWRRERNREFEKEGKASTGFGGLDRRLGGGIGKGIWLLGSEPSIGKTSLALQIARRTAREGAEVLFISFEQEAVYLEAKIIAAEMTEFLSQKTTPDEVMSGRRKEEAEELTESETLFERIYFAHGEKCVNEQDLLEIIQKYGAQKGPEALKRNKPCIVFIDYLQIIPFAQGSGIRFQIDDFTRRLRQVQMQTGICVFLISSLNRMSYMGPVRLDSFKESGIIEFTGDVILGLNLKAVRDSEYARLTDSAERNARLEAARSKRVRELEISCLKNKTGESNFIVEVNFDTESGIFTETGKGR